MKTLKFKIDEHGWCSTPCPLNPTTKIGSSSCEFCKFNKGTDLENNTVKCSGKTVAKKTKENNK